MSERTNDLLSRALSAYLRNDVPDQRVAVWPSEHKLVELEGREYIVLSHQRRVLKVYRVRTDGVLKGMKRWPDEVIQLAFESDNTSMGGHRLIDHIRNDHDGITVKQLREVLEDGEYLGRLGADQESVEEAHDMLGHRAYYVMQDGRYWYSDGKGYTQERDRAGIFPATELHRYPLDGCTLHNAD